MLQALKFVKGAIAKRDFAPILTHFGIGEGRIVGYNGLLALSSPINLDLVVNPKADMFANAISNCSNQVQITQLPSGNISVRSGSFRATIPCDPSPFPAIKIGGTALTVEAPILPALKAIEPFISEDASRPWSRGVLFRGKSAFATNNVCIVEYWIGCHSPVEFCIPSDAVAEMLRIGEEPESLEITDCSLTIHYSKDRWLFTSTVEGKWPDVSGILDRYNLDLVSFPPTFFDALRMLKNFIPKDGTCRLEDGKIVTGADDNTEGEVEIPDFHGSGKYAWKYLTLLEGLATKVDFSSVPCGFVGKNLRGLISGWSNED